MAQDLTPQEERFCTLCTKGTQADAYREAFPERVLDDDEASDIAVKSSKMAARPAIRARMRQLIDEARIQDMASVGSVYRQLCDLLDKATEAANWTACAAFMRLKLQVHGLLKETVTLAMEQTISDDELVKRVAKDNPALAKLLTDSVGKENAYAE
jgi:hypothetical protein